MELKGGGGLVVGSSQPCQRAPETAAIPLGPSMHAVTDTLTVHMEVPSLASLPATLSSTA